MEKGRFFSGLFIMAGLVVLGLMIPRAVDKYRSYDRTVNVKGLPELTFQMAVEDYRRQGYSDRWINERMRSIEMRKELTDEWHRSGIHEPKDFAILTNVLTKAWSGMTTGEYKRHKGLTKENLRDNMTNVALALNTLAEVATTEIARQRQTQGMRESRQAAQAGGQIAKNTRDDLERQLGRTVISSERASDYIKPIDSKDAEAQPLPEEE